MVQEFNGILVVVDRFSKYATFIPTKVLYLEKDVEGVLKKCCEVVGSLDEH